MAKKLARVLTSREVQPLANRPTVAGENPHSDNVALKVVQLGDHQTFTPNELRTRLLLRLKRCDLPALGLADVIRFVDGPPPPDKTAFRCSTSEVKRELDNARLAFLHWGYHGCPAVPDVLANNETARVHLGQFVDFLNAQLSGQRAESGCANGLEDDSAQSSLALELREQLKLLNETEKNIIEALAIRQPQTGDELANRSKGKLVADGGFKGTLSGLVKALLLKNQTGYILTERGRELARLITGPTTKTGPSPD